MSEYHYVNLQDNAKAIVGDQHNQYNFLFLESVPSKGLNLDELTNGLRDLSQECQELKGALSERHRDVALKALRKDVEILVDRVEDLQFHLAEDEIPISTGWHRPAFELQQFVSSYSYMLEDVRHQLQSASNEDATRLGKVAGRCRSSLADLSLKLRVAVALFCAFQSTHELSMQDAEQMTVQLRELIETIEDGMSTSSAHDECTPLSQTNLSDVNSDRELIRRRYLRQSLLSDAQSLRTVSMQVSSYLASLQTSDKSSGGVRLSSTLSVSIGDKQSSIDRPIVNEAVKPVATQLALQQLRQRASLSADPVHQEPRETLQKDSKLRFTPKFALSPRIQERSGLQRHGPSLKEMLSQALTTANKAVILDTREDTRGAVDAYKTVCDLLQQVYNRSNDAEDRRKLSAIRQTYLNRLVELDDLNKLWSKSSETNYMESKKSPDTAGDVCPAEVVSSSPSYKGPPSTRLRAKSPIHGRPPSPSHETLRKRISDTSAKLIDQPDPVDLPSTSSTEETGTSIWPSIAWDELMDAAIDSAYADTQ